MTHALALSLSSELKRALDAEGSSEGQARARGLLVVIRQEAFTLASSIPWGAEDQGEGLAECTRCMTPGEACYLLFRMERGGTWALISYIPDAAPVRDKMLYSSSSATLKRTLGGGDTFALEVHWSSLEEAAIGPDQKSDQSHLLTATERLAIAEDRMVAMEQAHTAR